MQLPQLGLVTSIALSLNLATLAMPINPATRTFLAPVMAQTAEERKVEADRLLDQGIQHLEQREIPVNKLLLIAGDVTITVEPLEPSQERLEELRQELERLQKVLIVYEIGNDRVRQGSSFKRAGEIYSELEDYEQAIESYHRALEIYEELDDRETEVSILGPLGHITDNCLPILA
jgi:tetratricopeptide (TPR) repeat protein